MRKTAYRIYLLLLIVAAGIITMTGLDHGYFMLIAIGMLGCAFALLMAITGRPVQSLALVALTVIILQLVNQLKVHYYKERLFFSDFYVAADIHNLGTLWYYQGALLCLFALLGWLIITAYLFRHPPILKPICRWTSLGLALILGIGVYGMSHVASVQKAWQQSLPKGKGVLLNLYYSAQHLSYESPAYSTSDTYFLKKAAATRLSALPTPEAKPDIVIFLQESTFNAKHYRFDTTPLPDYTMFNQPYGGLMRVQTFGGKTWLTEFALLTGLTSDDFGLNKNAVFYSVIPHIRSSLFRELTRNGYETIVLSPMGFANYNAGPSYRALGMNRFYQPQDLGHDAPKNTNLWHISSADMLKYVRKLLDQVHDKPRFIFVLSMAEHGPYDTNRSARYDIQEKTGDASFSSALTDYLERMGKLNRAVMRFIRYIHDRPTPTLFTYFGDHQASLGWSGGYHYRYRQPDYITQFSLASNYPMRIKNNPLTDISLLGGLVLENAGITSLTPFYQANVRMRYLCDGQLDDCADKKLVNSYKHYIYNTLGIASHKN